MVKNPPVNAGDVGLIPGSGRSPGKGNGNTPVFFSGEFQGQKSLADYSPWGHKNQTRLRDYTITATKSGQEMLAGPLWKEVRNDSVTNPAQPVLRWL